MSLCQRLPRRGAAAAALVLAGALTLTGCGDDAPSVEAIDCSYQTAPGGVDLVQKPSNLDVPVTGELLLQLRTTAGNMNITLDRAGAPCAVHSFESLLKQAYFVRTPCHRLTAPPAAIAVLQCGDPTGTGAGGPGYVVADEPPTGLDRAFPDSPESTALIYPRGTIALANRGVPNSGGSQFFLVYRDSVLPAGYSMIGTVDEDALPVLDAIAAAGTDDSAGAGDGWPANPVTLNAIDVRRPN